MLAAVPHSRKAKNKSLVCSLVLMVMTWLPSWTLIKNWKNTGDICFMDGEKRTGESRRDDQFPTVLGKEEEPCGWSSCDTGFIINMDLVFISNLAQSS